MRKYLLILLTSLSFVCHSQQEIKLDFTDAIALKTLEITYEYILTDVNSLGVSAFLNFQDRSSDFRYGEDRALTGFVRHYFSNDKEWNFFGELFLMFNKGEKDVFEANQGMDVPREYNDLALGLSGGYKYISKKGFVIETHIGLGRNLFSGSKGRDTLLRIGLNLGYRFK